MRRQNSHPQKKERIDRIVCFWPENATTMATLERGRRPASLCIREAAASRPASWMSLVCRRPPRRAATRRSLVSARRLLHGSAARELLIGARCVADRAQARTALLPAAQADGIGVRVQRSHDNDRVRGGVIASEAENQAKVEQRSTGRGL
jgi:hypothetical protein